MYAIVDFMGYQFKIQKDDTVKVPYIAEQKIGDEVKLERILMIHNQADVSYGTPIIDTAYATAEIVKHGREPKIIVFRKKRRKGYRKTRGHKQDFTQIKIKELVV